MNDATPPPIHPPALDAAALDRLRELDPDGRHGVLQRVLSAFETSLVRMHAQVSAELPQPDPEVLKSVAHTLKASSAAVGATSLARHCTELERGLREGSITDPALQARRLLAEAEAAQLAVAAMLRP
jgi:HPt (histidine-containing phosphotransfer) domain-containing protein